MKTCSTLGIEYPLPGRYLTEEPGVGGRIKLHVEDFLVEELPLYEPSGEGEHLYLGIQKTNVSHTELLGHLRRYFHVTEREIGFAGMKDKTGVTRQVVSIHLPEDPPSAELDHVRIKVLWAARHANKLRTGHLRGNRFAIRIRNVDPMLAPRVQKILRKLEEVGVPNYFGAQRFGYRGTNHKIGAAILQNDWKRAVHLLLGSEGGPVPPHQTERRQLFDEGRINEAAKLWTPADRSEFMVCNKLAKGRNDREACRSVGKTTLAFWISALQSAVFNRVVDGRLDDRSINTLVEGDLAWKHDNGSVFRVTRDELAGGDLNERLVSKEISPSGPLWGNKMTQAEYRTGEIEWESIQATGLTPKEFLESEYSRRGSRRPLRCPLVNTSLDAGTDEHGPYIRVKFDLPRGSFATVVLREIMKTEEKSDGELPD